MDGLNKTIWTASLFCLLLFFPCLRLSLSLSLSLSLRPATEDEWRDLEGRWDRDDEILQLEIMGFQPNLSNLHRCVWVWQIWPDLASLSWFFYPNSKKCWGWYSLFSPMPFFFSILSCCFDIYLWNLLFTFFGRCLIWGCCFCAFDLGFDCWTSRGARC